MHKIVDRFLLFQKLLRTNHWIKNGFIGLPLFFGGEVLNIHLLSNTIAGFIVFSFMASGIYILNDVIDYPFDRNHPAKKNRPVAAGTITKTAALSFSATLISLSLTLSFVFFDSNVSISLVLASYLAINIAYSLWLKKIVVLDVFIIALGFILRIQLGGYTAEVTLSFWIIMLTFLISLFLGFAKRRDDLLIQRLNPSLYTRITTGYSLEVLNLILASLSGTVIMSYLMYTHNRIESAQNLGNWFFLTAIPVVYGVLRYLMIALETNLSSNPTDALFKDLHLVNAILTWIALNTFFLYLL
jgi:4-hydroxybenzoate polyprenyltransferase